MTVAEASAPLHRIREVRLAKGWSQERLARALDMERTDIVRLELYTKEPRLATLIAVARALDVEFIDLLAPGVTKLP